MRRSHALTVLSAFLALAAGAWWAASLDRGARDGGTAPRPRDAALAPTQRAVERAQSTPDSEPAQGAAASGAPLPTRVVPSRRILFEGAEPLPGALRDVARRVLTESWRRAGLQHLDGQLCTVQEFDTLSGHHLRLEQLERGVPVHGSEVAVHVAPDGRPLLLTAQVFPLDGAARVPRIDAAAADRTARELVLGDAGDPGDERAEERAARPAELVFLPRDKSAVLAWRVDVGSTDESVRVFVDAVTGEPVRLETLEAAVDGQARVFDPNPVYSRRDPDLKDKNDAEQAVLSNERVYVVLPRLDGSGMLRGQWADATPSPSPASSVSLTFTSLSRSDERFEQVMCYYHVDRAQQRLQDLGITQANAKPQACNAHARSDDQSIFDTLTGQLLFGDGGVDDAEDADVIVHEYGHAVQFSQVRNFGLSGQAGAIGEGFSDFFAVAFHDSGSALYDAAVASWDATAYSTAVVPNLRRVDGTKVYPDDFTGLVHEDGEIWSRFLWDLRGIVGNDESLRLVVESHFLLSPNPTFRDAANAVLLTNVAIRGAADDTAIRTALRDRGLPFTAPVPTIEVEDAFEPNDSIDKAAPLDPGVQTSLLLADEDWYRLVVPSRRRLHVTAAFDGDAIDLDLELRDAAGRLIGASRGLASLEELDADAGDQARVVYLRAFDAHTGVAVGRYDLAVTETDLPTLKPRHTYLIEVEPDTHPVFRVDVPQSRVDHRAKLKVVTKRVRATGALADLQVVDPNGAARVSFGEVRKRKGAKSVTQVDVAGEWIVVLAPRDQSSGRLKVRAVLSR